MQILIAPDKFKGSLTASQAARAIADGLHQAHPDWKLDCAPLADGGDGTLDAIESALGGTRHTCTVTGPLGSPVQASYLILPDGHTAVIETAQACGLSLFPAAQRDPLRATTYGVGQLLGYAVDHGCTRALVGLGGSATNDGGLGFLAALGARLTDAYGRDISSFDPQSLLKLAHIDLSPALARLAHTTLEILCDVQNPLCGPQGATAVFGPQKGVTPAQLPLLDHALFQWGQLLEYATGRAVCCRPGAGAAGGLGAALLSLGGIWHSGVSYLMHLVHWKDRIACADIVLTGEGRLDASSLFGKAPYAVMQSADTHGIPCYAFCGAIQPSLPAVTGLSQAYCIAPHLPESIRISQAASLLQMCVHRWALQFPLES